MKKFLIIPAVVLTAVIAVNAGNSDFVSSFKSCTHYSESGNVNTEGLNVTSTKQILGREGNKCVYKESVKFSGIEASTVCKFTDAQVNEIVSVMQAYSLVQRYSDEDVDTSSLSAVSNNPIVKVWNKYLQDSNVCTFGGLGGFGQ